MARKAAQPPGMRCLPRLLIKWVLDAFDRIGREDEPGRPMFTHVVMASDEREQVRMGGAREVLELLISEDGSHEEDIFVTMMSYGVVVVALVLFWVRLVDVVDVYY